MKSKSNQIKSLIMNTKEKNRLLLEILEMLKEDFEMLQDGSWDLNQTDGSEVQASIDNVDKAISILKL